MLRVSLNRAATVTFTDTMRWVECVDEPLQLRVRIEKCNTTLSHYSRNKLSDLHNLVVKMKYYEYLSDPKRYLALDKRIKKIYGMHL